jgi:VanZ family protein
VSTRGLHLREFRRPGLWLGLWCAAIVAVIVASLIPPPKMTVPHGFDKVEHLLGYLLLSAGAVLLFARRGTQLKAGLGLVAMGIVLEFAQAGLTQTRAAEPADALANASGVVLGLLLSFSPMARGLQWLDRRLL